MTELNEKAKKIFALKYSTGKTKTWKESCRKIADFVSEGERPYKKTDEQIKEIADETYDHLINLHYIPGGRIIANAGTGIKNLANCITGDTKIYTLEHGLIDMQNVVSGNHVLTHKNRFKKVLNIWSNGFMNASYYHKGRNNSKKYSIGATDNHQIFSKNKEWIQINKTKNICIEEPKLNSNTIFPSNFTFEYPLNLYEEVEGKIIKLNKCIGKIGGSGLVEKYDKRCNTLNTKFFNDEDIAYLFGLYLAEGAINGNIRLYFTFNSNETHLIESVINISNKYFGITPYIQYSTVGKWVQVSIYSEILCQFFKNIFGNGCTIKRIPEWVFSSTQEYANKFLQGILDGDGHTKRDGKINLVLANPTLVYECVLLSRYCGYKSNFIYESKNKLSKNDTSKASIHTSVDTDYIHYLSSSIKEVFDMEVEDDNSFVAGDVICHNCFVLGIKDSRDSIYNTLHDAAEIFADGGGVGYNFSHIREKGADIKTTGGKASGPLSFMSLFDQTGEVISQASRRGAQLGALDINHGDIEEFIGFKSTLNSRNERLMQEYDRNLHRINGSINGTKYEKVLEKTLLDDQLTHFNISVMITNEFMEAVKNDEDWELKSVTTNETVKKLKAKDLLWKIAKQAHTSADPGLIFKSRVNKDNLVPYMGEIEATNP